MKERNGEARCKKPLLSIVVPLFNEEEVIQLTHTRIADVLGSHEEFDLEIIYVDDGSKDRSAKILSEIAAAEPRVSVITFSRNFGHQPAITAGLRHATGNIVAVVDADLQDPVELIPEMVTKWREGYAVVYGIRRTRDGSSAKNLGYSLFYRVLSLISEIDMPKDSGDFCLLDREAVDAINQLPERNRFVRGLRAWYGGEQIGIAYDRPTRLAGSSHYSIGKSLNLALDGLSSFSVVPLRLIFWLGVGLSGFALLGLLYFLLQRIGYHIVGEAPSGVQGHTSLVLTMLLVSGVQLLSIGILGEYLGRVYLEVKNRPEYVIARLKPSLYGQSAPKARGSVSD